MESKPVSTKQKESSVTILIDNIPIQISTDQYNHIIILNLISSFHTLPNIPLKTKLK